MDQPHQRYLFDDRSVDYTHATEGVKKFLDLYGISVCETGGYDRVIEIRTKKGKKRQIFYISPNQGRIEFLVDQSSKKRIIFDRPSKLLSFEIGQAKYLVLQKPFPRR